MKKLHLLLLILLLCSIKTLGQVGINTDQPDDYAGLHVSERMDPTSTNPDKYNGIIIQRYTEAQRDAQLTPNMGATQNSLLIYNTTEDCYNYWNNVEQEWKSLCGALGKSVFTFDCSEVTVKGSYVEGRELTAANYLSIPVTVTKAGEYTIIATTPNGYSFFVSGTFLNTGSYTIQVPGQGTPVAVQTDDLAINANGVDVDCTPPVQVNVLSAAGTYTMSCGSATVNGVYKVGTVLTASNTITLPINVTNTGSYTITTNTVNGISFSGSGTFSAIGNQNITLYGNGTPSSTTVTILTITSDSQGGVSTTCNVRVIIVIPIKSIVHLGGTGDHGYSAFEDASRNLLDEPANFGVNNNSIVKAEGFTHTRPVGASNIVSALNSKPDIVITGYPFSPSASEITALVSYLNAGGVVIAHLEDSGSVQNFMRSIFGDATITGTGRNGGGAVYSLVNYNDEILNGPFGDARGKNWGEDASATIAVANIPASMITAYSQASAINSTSTYTGITMFKHNSLNLFYVGDAGFLSNYNGNGTITSNTAYPFATNSNNLPVQKSAYGTAGNGYTAGSMQVQNSIIFANALAWAIKQAEFNGINAQ